MFSVIDMSLLYECAVTHLYLSNIHPYSSGPVFKHQDGRGKAASGFTGGRVVPQWLIYSLIIYIISYITDKFLFFPTHAGPVPYLNNFGRQEVKTIEPPIETQTHTGRFLLIHVPEGGHQDLPCGTSAISSFNPVPLPYTCDSPTSYAVHLKRPI